MGDVLLSVLGLVGATIIFTWSPLFARVRAFYPTMLECAMCVGFWVGALGDVYLRGAPSWVTWPSTVLFGSMISLLAFTTSTALEVLHRRA